MPYYQSPDNNFSCYPHIHFSVLWSCDQTHSCFLHFKSARLCSSICFSPLLVTQMCPGAEHVSFKTLQQQIKLPATHLPGNSPAPSSSLFCGTSQRKKQQSLLPSTKMGICMFSAAVHVAWNSCCIMELRTDHTGPRFALSSEEGALSCRMRLGNPKRKLYHRVIESENRRIIE